MIELDETLLARSVSIASKIIAANVYATHDSLDVVDFILFNAQEIIKIAVDKYVAIALIRFIPAVRKLSVNKNILKRFSFYGISGLSSAAVSTAIVYPLQLLRDYNRQRKLQKKDEEQPAPQFSPSIKGVVVTYLRNVIPATVDVAFEYGRKHAGVILLVVGTASIAAAQYALTSSIDKLGDKIFPAKLK